MTQELYYECINLKKIYYDMKYKLNVSFGMIFIYCPNYTRVVAC